MSTAPPLPTGSAAPPAINHSPDPTQALTLPSPPTPAPVDPLPPTPTTFTPQPHPEELSSGKKLTPFASPLPHCTPIPPPALTPEQQQKYTDFLTQITSAPNGELKGLPSPLTDVEKMFLTKDCLLRYLRAAKWDISAAYTRLISTLVWRREYSPHTLSAEHISPENETGKQWILGFDHNARPCLSLNPARQNTNPSDRQIQHLVFMLERSIDLMPPGQETLALKINFANATSGKTPSLSTGKQVLSILQNHYPERLGKAISFSLPWFVSTFYKLITPFIDPLTREKLVFPAAAPTLAEKEKKKGKGVEPEKDAEITNYVPKEHLELEVGGSCEFEYKHDVYWPALVQLCKKKSEEYERRWRERGGRIGDSEVILRGGQEGELKN